MKIVIIGAGVAGLSLQYFLAEKGIESIIIDKKSRIGYPIRDTGLISNTSFHFFPEIKDKVVEEVFDESEFIFDDFSIKFSSKKSSMYMLNRSRFDNEIFNLTKSMIREPKLLLGKRVATINKKANFVLLEDGKKIDYDVLVGADGTYSIVTKTFGLDKKISYVVAQEAIFKTRIKQEKKIRMFFSDKYSKEHFLWKISYDNKLKIGYMDKYVNEKFLDFANSIKEKKVHEYSDLIKIGKVKLVDKNVIVVGEASGLIKPFSLGGISYGIISSFIASHFIERFVDNEDLKELLKYENAVRLVLNKGMMFGYLSKEVFKIIKRNNIFRKLLKISKANKLAKVFHPDFINTRFLKIINSN